MQELKPTLFTVHGFLGQPSDWDGVLPEGFETRHFDLFSGRSLTAQKFDFGSLSRSVCSWARKDSAESPRVLVGYSLGGRIALHALIEAPHLWDAAVMISAHPGIAGDTAESQAERQVRILSDEVWAHRFETQEWSPLLATWNSQPVLSQTSEVQPRLEQDFSRSALAGALRGCSLGQQADLRPHLARISVPVLWVVGERDSKFSQLGEEVCALNPRFALKRLPGAGHRAPWDQLDLFKTAVTEFVNFT